MVDARDGAATASSEAKTGGQPGPDPLIGRTINDRYKILGLIARGGMGKVYRGEQAPLGRPVALKILHPNYKGEHDPDFHRRFFLEAATCAKLTHPNTVTIFDYGRTEDDVYYIAMELLEGRTLHRALREDGPFPPARALHVARQVCRSLREAHGIHVVHRDLKPANVFLCRRDDDPDFVKVLDFGLVKNTEETAEDLTQTGLFMGSPKYMAPEQIQGDKADGRVDIYALGVILYEMLTGKVPFDRPNSVNVLMAHVHDAPPSFEMALPGAQIPPALEAVVMKCLEKRPVDRYATMDQLLLALKAVSESGQHSLTSSVTSSNELSMTSGELSIVAKNPPEPSLTPSGVVARFDAPAVAAAAAPAASASVQESPTRAPEAPRRVPTWAWGVGVGVLLAVGVGAGLALRGPSVSTGTETRPGTDTETSTATGTETSAGAGTETSAGAGTGAGTSTGSDTETRTETGERGTDVAPAPSRVRISITTTPPGASVRVGEHRFGPTPVEVELEGDEARPGTQLTFVFSLAGHQLSTVRRTVEGDTLVVDARLQRRSGGMSGADTTHVEGYRDDPY
ncbi:MAG: hypothetical protein OHK0013_41600 [Sandaracinaceae bacterium]